MQPKVILSAAVTFFSMLAPPLAQAHEGVHLTAGLVDGFMHPVSGLDHLIIAIAAGFWAARSGDHGLRDMSLFLALFAGGMLLGLVSQAWPLLEITLPVLFLLIVTVIAVAIACPSCFMQAFLGSFALWHGMVHMLEMPLDAALPGFAFGLLLATGVLLTLGLILRTVVSTYLPHRHA